MPDKLREGQDVHMCYQILSKIRALVVRFVWPVLDVYSIWLN